MFNRWHIVFLATVATAAFGLVVAVGFKQVEKSNDRQRLQMENTELKNAKEKGWILHANSEREYRHMKNFQDRLRQNLPEKYNSTERKQWTKPQWATPVHGRNSGLSG